MYPWPYDGFRMKIKNEVSQTKDKNFDVLVLGDCYNLEGVDSNIIASNTEMTVFNFATHTNYTIWASKLMLKNYLEHNSKRPKYIVMTFLPKTFIYSKKSAVKSGLPFLYEFKKGNIKEFIKEFGHFATLKILIPSLKHQEYFRNILIPIQMVKKVVDLREKIKEKEMTVEKFVRSVHDAGGYYGKYGYQFYKEFVLSAGQRYGVEPSEFFKRNFGEILDMARENNVDVIYHVFSAPPDWFKLYYDSSILKSYLDYIEAIKGTYPNVDFIHTQTFMNKMSYYRDSTHLNWGGTKVLAEFLSYTINRLEKEKEQ